MLRIRRKYEQECTCCESGAVIEYPSGEGRVSYFAVRYYPNDDGSLRRVSIFKCNADGFIYPSESNIVLDEEEGDVLASSTLGQLARSFAIHRLGIQWDTEKVA